MICIRNSFNVLRHLCSSDSVLFIRVSYCTYGLRMPSTTAVSGTFLSVLSRLPWVPLRYRTNLNFLFFPSISNMFWGSWIGTQALKRQSQESSVKESDAVW
jgi:hypothetical protein